MRWSSFFTDSMREKCKFQLQVCLTTPFCISIDVSNILCCYFYVLILIQYHLSFGSLITISRIYCYVLFKITQDCRVSTSFEYKEPLVRGFFSEYSGVSTSRKRRNFNNAQPKKKSFLAEICKI